MKRHELDKSSKWLMQQHGNAVLYLGGVRGRPPLAGPAGRGRPAAPTAGRAARSLPSPAGRSPTTSFVEVATYPEPRLVEQAFDDLMLAYQQLRQLPELLTVVLHPKGALPRPGRLERTAGYGWSRLGGALEGGRVVDAVRRRTCWQRETWV